MSGHSKWAQIKRQKGVADVKRGQVFTKLGREISVAVREGGPSPDANPRLRLAVDRARAANMPIDTIDRAIKRAAGGGEGQSLDQITYEGYGPGGAALLIQATTDNPNRTVAEIRHIFDRQGGNLGTSNSVAWMFDKKGQILVDAARHTEDATMEAALEAGAEDMVKEGDQYVITTEPAALHAVLDGLKAKGIAALESEIAMLPKNTVKVEKGDASRLLKLMEAVEEHDDVAKVFSNFDIDAETLAAVGG